MLFPTGFGKRRTDWHRWDLCYQLLHYQQNVRFEAPPNSSIIGCKETNSNQKKVSWITIRWDVGKCYSETQSNLTVRVTVRALTITRW